MGMKKRGSEDIDIEGPLQHLFCPVCCDGSRYRSNYSLRSHVKEEHFDEMENRCRQVARSYINGGYDTEEFYVAIDEDTPVYIDEFDE